MLDHLRGGGASAPAPFSYITEINCTDKSNNTYYFFVKYNYSTLRLAMPLYLNVVRLLYLFIRS